MLSFFESMKDKLADNKTQSVESKGPKKEKFFTQSQMMKNYGLSEGVCGELANAWLETRINNEEPTFLKDEEETFKIAMQVKQERARMNAAGGTEMRKIAFSKTKTEHKQALHETSKLKTPAGVDEVVGGARHTLIGYPTRVNNQSHMIGFENDNGKGECRLFDANMFLGEAKGPCAELKKTLAMSISARGTRAETGQPSYVVSSTTP